jgi:hypothetical protein
MVKLYLPYGYFKGRRSQLMVHWFVKDRESPVAPYAELVEKYNQLPEESRARARRVVDELFTEAEFHALRDYLRVHLRQDVRTAMLVAPINSLKQHEEANRGLIRPFGDSCEMGDSVPEVGDGVPGRMAGGGRGFCRLAEEDGYTLPFAVWGYWASS